MGLQLESRTGMVRRYGPIVEEVEEGFELLAGNLGDGDRGVVRCPFLGALLLFVGGLWEGEHILEKTGLRHEEVFVHAIQATVDLERSRSVPLANIPNTTVYLENGHISVHIVFRVAIHAHTAERRIEFE